MDAYDEPLKQTNEALGTRLANALVSRGFTTAAYAATAAEALEAAAALIPDGVSVGVPGTVTVRQIGLMERLAEKKCAVFHHWDPSLTKETRPARLKEENAADWFVTSSNAVTADGRLVNIDGTGNRVSAMAWGTGKLLFIIGINKVARDLEHAIARARDSATPPNTIRVGMTTPCVKTGRCVDCNAPERSCRAILILERVPFGREAHAIIAGENLGY
jgi:hypothetical protein